MRFLIIDEDDFTLTLLTQYLKDSFNCQVDQVKYSQKGIRLLKTEVPYDFIIADYQSPECLGFELRSFQIRHSIPGKFVFYTNVIVPCHFWEGMSSSLVKRYSFESLRKFIINNIEL